MPRLTNLTTVRALLDRDRVWAVYAIGDLSPELIDHCEWHAPAGAAPALLLVYRGFDPSIAFAMGDPTDLAPLFREVRAPAISLHMRPEALEAMAGAYMPTSTRWMRRMVLGPGQFEPVAPDDVQPVGEPELRAVLALYEDGHRRGDGPTFFHPAMLAQDTFRGIWEDGALVAIAGTHLYSPDLGICAIGNVYTRSDRRERGLAARVTSAVAAHAVRQRIRTIALNVGHDNPGAERVYARLGFAPYCDFLEGEACRVEGDSRVSTC